MQAYRQFALAKVFEPLATTWSKRHSGLTSVEGSGTSKPRTRNERGNLPAVSPHSFSKLLFHLNPQPLRVATPRSVQTSDYHLVGGEWNEPESEARVESVLRPLEDLLDEVRKDWIPRSPDEVDWSWEVETRVRIAELEHRISTDLSQMRPSNPVQSLMGPPMSQVKSLEKDDASRWWLIDSGASVTVIAKRYLDEFQILDRKALGPNERYSAANDTPVSVFERVRIRALLPMYEGQQYLGLISVYVTGVVADVAHNILSAEQMVRTGWEVKFTRKEISLRHEKKGVMGYGVSWAGCPWIYLQGDAEKRKKVIFGGTEVRPMEVDDGRQPMEVDQMQSVKTMTKKKQEEMELRRM